MLRTHPDIAYAVMQLARQSANPMQEHLDKALHMYLPISYQHSQLFTCVWRLSSPSSLYLNSSTRISVYVAYLWIASAIKLFQLSSSLSRRPLRSVIWWAIHLGTSSTASLSYHDILCPSLALRAHLHSWSSNLRRYLAQSVSHDLQTFPPFLCLLCTFDYDTSLFSFSTSSALRYLCTVCTAPASVSPVRSSGYYTFHLPSYSPLLLIHFHLHI